MNPLGISIHPHQPCSHGQQTHPSLRRSIRRATGLAMAVLAFAAAIPAQNKAAPSAPSDGSQSQKVEPKSKIDIEKILANPIFENENFKYLYLKRGWLAGQGGRIESFEKIAQEFADHGALFSAIELLWFAEKMTDDEGKRQTYQNLMLTWKGLAEPADRLIEEGKQLLKANRAEEALNQFKAAIQLSEYSEKGHYQLAKAYLRHYQNRAMTEPELAPLAVRTRAFRLAYIALHYTIAIDPFYYDAYLALSNLREIIPDDREFLIQTQTLTDRALRFRNEVIPSLEKIEAGDRSAELFDQLGQALESTGVIDYAVFAYQTAIHRGSTDPETRQRLDALVNAYFSN